MAGRLGELTPSPAAGFEQPFDMLRACHERIERTLGLLQRLRAHLATHGADAQTMQAARDVLRYFDVAAPQHHLDEERHLLPVLEATGDGPLIALAQRLRADHRAMERAWAAARSVLGPLADGALAAPTAGQDASLQAFTALYTDHLAVEEAMAFPAARAGSDDTGLASMGADMRRRRGAS